MPIATIATVQQEIVTVIKRFKFEEIEPAVMPLFPEISWTNIKSELVKRHKKFTATNVAQLLRVIVTESKVQEKILRDRLSVLQLLDISWHSSRKIWYGYTLTGSSKPITHLLNRYLQENIQDYFNTVNMKINVKVNTHNGITYLSLTVEKSKSKKGKGLHSVPIYFALFMGQKYFFSTKKIVSPDILNAVARCLGYKGSKRFKLMGRNLKSLNELCWRKKEGATDFENVRKTSEYKNAPPEKKETGIDFTQQRQRRKYAEKCFGENPPTLELLVINGPSIPISHETVSTELPDENIRVTWEFRSRNIAACLTKLIERRVLVTPVPYYISNIMMLGKNELTLQSDQ